MKVIIQQTAGKDYPLTQKGNAVFYVNQEEQIRKRLELRAQDKVEIQEVER